MTKSKKSVKKPSYTKAATGKSVQSVVARSDDGTIQITFTIPYKKIESAKTQATLEISRDIEVPGFRKGKAPLDKVVAQIPQNTLIEKTLSKVLPNLYGDAIVKHKIKPAIYPKFELVKAQEGENWQVRATTCELPDVKLGDYKKAIKGTARAKSIWTPDKGKPEDEGKENQLTREQKEQEILKMLLDTVKVDVPKLLIDEEVNSRLSKLLERIEKLGLNLESYISSLGKTAEELRKDYQEQSKQAILLDIILAKIAETENVKVDKSQIDAAISAGSADPKLTKKLDTPEQRRLIESILRRRAALDSLTSLI